MPMMDSNSIRKQINSGNGDVFEQIPEEELSQLLDDINSILSNNTFRVLASMVIPTKVINPATVFTKESRDGKYNVISDSDYDILLDECKKATQIFQYSQEVNIDLADDYNRMIKGLQDAYDAIMNMIQAKKIVLQTKDYKEKTDNMFASMVKKASVNHSHNMPTPTMVNASSPADILIGMMLNQMASDDDDDDNNDDSNDDKDGQ